FLEAIFDGSNMKVYVNGNQVGSSSSQSSICASTAPFAIGTRYASGVATTSPYTFNGFIDDVKFYPYSRSAAQVKSDYLQGAGKIGSSAVLGQQTTEPLNKGLVGYWKTDEATWSGTLNEVVDSSGNGVHGTAAGATGGKAYPTGGKFGNGGFFDGVDDYVDVPGGTSITFGGDMTVSAWMKTSSSAERPILSNRTSGGTGSGRFYFGINGGKAFLYHNSASPPNVSAVTSINNNAWHLLTYVRSGTTTNIYVDGVLDKTTTQTNYVNGAKAIRIGHDVDNVTEYFPGSIDDVRIYNRALSPSEVSQLYNFAPGPVGYWKMDEGSGTDANDNSGKGNTGTLTSGPTWVQGKYGKAVSFDGSDDNVNIPDQSNWDFSQGGLDAGKQDFTISAWTKLSSSIVNARPAIVGKAGNAAGSGGYTFWIPNGSTNLRLSLSDTINTIALDVTNPTSLADNKWHYLTALLDREPTTDTAYFYVDGKLVSSASSATIAGNSVSTTFPFRIGDNPGDSLSTWTGIIDDVKIYNYARTNQQIVEDMNAGHPTGGSPLGSQLIYWKLDEQQGNTINNSGFGGSTYNGTNSGATWLTNAVCKNNGCLSFDTTTDTVSAGDVAFVDAAASISASLWVNPQTLATNKMILSKANTTTQRVFQIKTDDTTAAKLKVMISSSST
ncbi:hypothetical protein HYV22_00705, partial [Candidatus Gottesmanbacteria bacterium]|nr:hypothetical protein [Candidatus Gottesmanbacteria bacterium]